LFAKFGQRKKEKMCTEWRPGSVGVRLPFIGPHQVKESVAVINVLFLHYCICHSQLPENSNTIELKLKKL